MFFKLITKVKNISTWGNVCQMGQTQVKLMKGVEICWKMLENAIHADLKHI